VVPNTNTQPKISQMLKKKNPSVKPVPPPHYTDSDFENSDDELPSPKPSTSAAASQPKTPKKRKQSAMNSTSTSTQQNPPKKRRNRLTQDQIRNFIDDDSDEDDKGDKNESLNKNLPESLQKLPAGTELTESFFSTPTQEGLDVLENVSHYEGNSKKK
jgi:hypothetical protein